MYPPGSGYPPNIMDLTTTCTAQGGEVRFVINKAISGSELRAVLLDQTQARVWSGGFGVDKNAQEFAVSGLVDGIYTLEADNGEAQTTKDIDISCGYVPVNPLKLTVDHTDETAALNDGSITLTPMGGTDPIYVELVDLSVSRQTAGGKAELFTRLSPQAYKVRATDSGTPVQIVESSVTILPYNAPRTGCGDEYADNFDPMATVGDDSCSYSVTWRSAWQPMAVVVPALAGQVAAYVTAELRIGFRPGHPLASDRPLGDALRLRATVGPDGYATFRLGPYLRPALGASDGAGGYRLDLNSPTAHSYDLYVGYELRRLTGELLEHGYALNSAVPDAELRSILSPFRVLPVWPGFEQYLVSTRYDTPGGFGLLGIEGVDGIGDMVYLPCPTNPLPVRWLAPGSGYGYWVFQGRTQFGDAVSEGQTYREALSGEQRYSDPGDAYQTFKASSGVFGGDDLLAGLRTLWRSPQAWVQLTRGGEWVPIVVERGTRDVGRMGVRRQEVVLNFSTAMPEWVQGQ